MSALDLDALEALFARASAGEWTAYRMTTADGFEADLRPHEIGEYVKNSVTKSWTESGSRQFLAVVVQKADGPADVCLVGNGPTSPANAKFIEAAHNAFGELLARARRLAAIETAARVRLAADHDPECLAVQVDDALAPLGACSCGHDALAAALNITKEH